MMPLVMNLKTHKPASCYREKMANIYLRIRFRIGGRRVLALVLLVSCLSFFLFLSPISSRYTVHAQPAWLKKGVYAVYRFKCAYALKGWETSWWELESLGSGYYRWEVLEVEGRLATLNVTLSTEKFTKSIIVTLDTETMDLIEDGKTWGKAWFWIDVTRFPAPPSATKVFGNITLVARWFNVSLKNTTVSRIYSITKESSLKPVKTGLGPVDKVITVRGFSNLTRLQLRIDEVLHQMISIGGITLSLSWCYEARYGLLVAGEYIDDILTQKFNVVFFKDMSGAGESTYWMYLEDTNLKIEVVKSVNTTSIFEEYFIPLLLGILAIIFAVAFIVGRRGGRF